MPQRVTDEERRRREAAELLRRTLGPETADRLTNPQTLAALKKAAQAHLDNRKVDLYRPYPKQAAFHQAGAQYRERLLLASNQTGKTFAAAAEASMHATGLYPVDWQGYRWDRATVGWAAGITSEVARDTVQRMLVGRATAIGSGMIPKRLIDGTTAARGISEALDTVRIKHVSGGLSTITFKSYNQERAKWQGETLDWVWMDEEPPYDLYSEALTRTNATRGLLWMTFTPLLGMSEVVRLFYPRPSTPDRFLVQMTIDDAEHIDAEQRAKVIASYKPHEREARTKGIPQLGSGKVFAIPESAFVVDAFAVPKHWSKIIGIDPGYDHPFGAVLLAHDKDTDTVYVVASYRAQQQTIMQHAAALKTWGTSIPVAWPHDASSHERSTGETFAEIYRRNGLQMLWTHATFADGGYGLEASIADITDRLEGNRLKIFSHLTELIEEIRMFHREDGKIVKQGDDLISALRYAIMMLRFAARSKDGAGYSGGAIKRGLRVA